ncbi:MAG: hypothetical protein WCW13_01730 [archaeon]|jgi:hypothetical protein
METDFDFAERMASNKATLLALKEIKEYRIKIRENGENVNKKGFFKLKLWGKMFFLSMVSMYLLVIAHVADQN